MKRHFIAILMAMTVFVPSVTMGQQVDFTLPDLQGEERSLSDFRGKWVLVNYWATWCPPCRDEMPELELFHNHHKDTDGVVLGINTEGVAVDVLKRFAEEQFISYPVLLGGPEDETVLGPVPGLPTSYLVSPAGEVVGRQVGAVTREMIENFIENYGH